METRLLDIIRGKFRHVLMAAFPAVIFLSLNAPIAVAQFFEAGVGKFKVPVEAPDFILSELDGGKVSLQDLRGNIIILNFFATS